MKVHRLIGAGARRTACGIELRKAGPNLHSSSERSMTTCKRCLLVCNRPVSTSRAKVVAALRSPKPVPMTPALAAAQHAALRFRQGAEAAAAVAQQYRTNHAYRLDDCILGKLNLTKRKRPRRNKEQLVAPKTPAAQFVAGLASALVTLVRYDPRTAPAVREVARQHKLTVSLLRRSQVDLADIGRLEAAGLPRRAR